MALPVNGSTHLIPANYSFYRPRKDERLSWPSWLTYSGWLTHISGHPSAAGRAQDILRHACGQYSQCYALGKTKVKPIWILLEQETETDVLPLCHATNCVVVPFFKLVNACFCGVRLIFSTPSPHRLAQGNVSEMTCFMPNGT